MATEQLESHLKRHDPLPERERTGRVDQKAGTLRISGHHGLLQDRGHRAPVALILDGGSQQRGGVCGGDRGLLAARADRDVQRDPMGAEEHHLDVANRTQWLRALQRQEEGGPEKRLAVVADLHATGQVDDELERLKREERVEAGVHLG